MTVDGLAIEPHPDGATIRVRAVPGASRERVVGVHGDALKIAVAAPPERGRANQRLIAVLARALEVPPRAFELVSGAGARDKRILLRGVDAATLRQRVAKLVGD